MSDEEEGSRTAAGAPAVKPGEAKLEVVVVPVSDVERAKRFYEGLGWRLDADLKVDDGYSVVQLTPPGSGCSVIFGEGVTSAPPGSSRACSCRSTTWPRPVRTSSPAGSTSARPSTM